ncbi:porin [Vibrio tubiashii]|jgi:predicted porin|uniref:Membrane protein n=1 Tax=Vibrio tubiashii ATCC 19109 TaxID=1051646 RepID=F9TA48_9VIBR|nr:porin [Vibrio tubiashii]AIW13718.1 membrane protein [Vibrio tubiashii ATCC 19109]EGU50462.1 porin-like protein H precursor [Vibrio tubiashii ATCC 19109]EIF01867.1 porin-like protein H [Vibrio tubiashii NCIMB 1337 = ATCC 19106]
MKKTLVALSVLMAATSAQAIELYNQDGVTVNMTGDVEVRYKKAIGNDQTTKQEIDDADFGFDTRYAVNDDLQVGAFLEFSGDNSDRANDKTSVGNVYVGFYHTTVGSLKIGKLDTQLDDAGIGSDYLFGVSSFFEDQGFGGEEAVRYDYDNGSFYAGLGLIQDKHDAQAIGKDGNYFDAKLGYRVADFDFTAFYGAAELKGTTTKDTETVDATTKVVTVTRATTTYDADQSLLALEARYAGFENLNLEVGYYKTELKPKSGTKSDTDTVAIAADYTWNKTTFAGGFAKIDNSVASKEDYNEWFLNAGYALAPNTTVYVEVGDNDKKNTDVGYGVGIKATF